MRRKRLFSATNGGVDHKNRSKDSQGNHLGTVAEILTIRNLLCSKDRALRTSEEMSYQFPLLFLAQPRGLFPRPSTHFEAITRHSNLAESEAAVYVNNERFKILLHCIINVRPL